MGHKLLAFFFTLICIPGLFAFTLDPSQNPVAVGSNVTISVKDPIPITVGSWLYESSILFMWYSEDLISGSNQQAGIQFNTTTFQLTLSSVTLKSSGKYALNALRPNNTRAEITLDVQEPVSNVTADVSMTNLVEFNDTVAFTCNANGTPLWFSWQNGSSAVTAGGRVQLNNNGRDLVISGVTRYDEGPFQCIVKNNISSRDSIQKNLTISYGPSNLRITVWPEKMVYTSGSAISLSCSADSKPSASFYWMYNGNPLNVNSWSYNLTDTTQNRTGLYTCAAQNAVTLRYVVVSKTIRIVDPISAVSVNPSGSPVEDMPFNLSCNVVGPVDSIQWLKNGTYLYADNTITFFNGNSTLSFKKLALTDDGLYTCAASNAVSNIESQAYNLMVNYGPINTTATGPDVVAEGSSVTFNCSSVSRPLSQYSWYFNGSMVAVGSVYVTAALPRNHSGQYTCMAFNNITGISSSASVHLTVLAPVSNVMVDMDNQQPIFNQTFTLTCTASGDVEHIQWMKNGVKMSDDSRITFSKNSSVLNFNPLFLNDEGLYQCDASNAVSNITSLAYDLKVSYGPWNITISGPAVGAVGQNMTFSCSATSYPTSQYSWFHNSSLVGNGSVYVTAALSLTNSGQYTCTAFNHITAGSSSASVRLTLKYPVSHVIVNVGNQSPIFNQPFTLTCAASGDVEHIHWMKNGMLLYPENGITFSIDNSALTFQNLSLNDDGHYQCVASNAVSNMTSQAYDLMVNYGPWNMTIKGPIMAETGSIVTFNCTADSRPQSQYSWFYNSSKVGNGSVYVTNPLTNSGQYTCMAFNHITDSSSSASVQLTVIDAITSVEVISDTLNPLASQSLKLKCDVKGHYDTLHWLRNNQSFQPSDRVTFSADNTTVTFTYLKTADDGMYQCVAANPVKQHPSNPYNLVVNFGPQSVQIIVHPGIPPKLTCQAVSQPPAEYHWILENNTVIGNHSTIVIPMKYILGSNYTCVAKNPLTNVTVYTSQVIDYFNAAVSVQASVVMTALLALLLPVLEEWL
ncbi:carcinoembryonic antigen-related cell adhesion molecule 1 isoform X1 [Chanodichthys erythropterus]|uniref:carcinoembryonic antigen-related cell adhesion molecule 1 isoform X1 n=1 Tax=Chanodichthys erythropterus TaxID=933992 RepID=UPI00351E30D1